MTLKLEAIGRVVRLVIDTVNECNLRCLYCHPGEVWREQQLPGAVVRTVLDAAEKARLFEVVLSGGEITLHRNLIEILEATHALKHTATTLITNATRITPVTAELIAASNVARLCVSVDGVNNDLHGSARGKNLPRVLDGLQRLEAAGKPVTVITVTHRRNWQRVIELSEFLAQNALAVQHHLCAPSYSGQAREHYPQLALREEAFYAVQRLVDRNHHRLLRHGLYLTFNSYWPATGDPTLVVNPGRTITLQQLSEQVKDSLCNVRPNGEFRLQATTWGREMVGNAVIGRVPHEHPEEILARAERRLATGRARQLPRAVEARHKFQLGDGADRGLTERLIGRAGGQTAGDPPTVPIRSIDAHWLMNNPSTIRSLAGELAEHPEAYRVARHPSGTVLVFERARSLVTLLQPDEWCAASQVLGSSKAVLA